jgi:hypothetical protein
LLLPTELGSLREGLEEWFEDTCDILRDTRADDDYGGRSDSYAVVASGVHCLVQPGMSVGHRTVEELAGELRQQMLFTISLPAGTDIRVNDRLQITSQNNLLLRVQVVLSPESMNMEDQVVANLLV